MSKKSTVSREVVLCVLCTVRAFVQLYEGRERERQSGLKEKGIKQRFAGCRSATSSLYSVRIVFVSCLSVYQLI